jgi:Protein of unknown function (Hypoth_ymh)
MRGECDVAVFQAMKAVEVYVREAGGFSAGDLGTDLMRRAFHEENGPLTDKTVEKVRAAGDLSALRGRNRFLQKPTVTPRCQFGQPGRSDGNRLVGKPSSPKT